MELALFVGIALLMFAIGYLAGRKQDTEGFHIYNRKLPGLSYVVSYVATFIGAGFFLVGTAYAYRYGLGLVWYFAGVICGVMVFGNFAGWLKKQTAGEKLYTLPDYFRWRFGDTAANVLTAISLVLLIGDTAIQLIGGGKILLALGVLDYTTSCIITTIVVATYLLFSGFRAVVWTDYVLLSAIIVLSGILAAFSFGELRATTIELNFASVPGGTIAGFFLFGVFSPFCVSHYYQRIFAAKDPDIARRSTWLSGLIILIPGSCLLIIGCAAKALFPSIEPDTAFIQTILHGGRFVALGGSVLLWAALMSTVDTLTFNGSQIVVRDLLKRPLTRTNTGVGIIAVLGLALSISLAYPSITDVAILFLAGGMSIAPSAFLSWLMPGLNRRAVPCSLVCGIVSLIGFSILVGITPALVVVTLATSFISLLVVHYASSFRI